MKRLKTVEEGVLYRNPYPGHLAICATSPNVVPLSERELLCFYRVGQALYSDDGRIAQLRSTDGGSTWMQEGGVWDARRDSSPGVYGAPHGSRLRDGTLLLIAQRTPPASKEYPFRFNPDTGGLKPTEIVLLRSHEQGHTWSEPEVLELLDETIVDAPSSVIELNDGRLFLGCERWKAWDDSSPLHIRGFALFSEDGGRTWGNRIDFPSAADTSKMYSHTRYTRMLDGRLCALQWTQSIGGQENHDLHFVISDKTGTKWSSPQATGIPGQNSWVADLGGGTLVASYAIRDREDLKPGVMVVLSEDEGQTWDLENQVVVWDAVGQNFLGTSHKPTYPASHDNIAFGKVNTVRLPGGDVLVSWWCTQACVVHMRYARLMIE